MPNPTIFDSTNRTDERKHELLKTVEVVNIKAGG